jgi:predicted nucleic acid-binding protein
VGLTVLDAGPVIALLDAGDAHHRRARAAFADALGRRDRLVLPASAFAETLVGPARRGPAAVATLRDAIRRLPIDVVPLGPEVALSAATLRARHRRLRLPDALVIATAAHLGADRLLTTDRGWPSRAELGLRAQVLEL